jgi:hypothetical protein
MRDRTSNEIRLAKNVDSWADNIEHNHSATMPFNRSLFQHVAVELGKWEEEEEAA